MLRLSIARQRLLTFLQRGVEPMCTNVGRKKSGDIQLALEQIAIHHTHTARLEIDQTATLLMLLLLSTRLRTKWVVSAAIWGPKGPRWSSLCRHYSILLRHTCELTVQEWIACRICCQPVGACACRVDKGSWCGMLCRNAEVANVAESILALTTGE